MSAQHEWHWPSLDASNRQVQAGGGSVRRAAARAAILVAVAAILWLHGHTQPALILPAIAILLIAMAAIYPRLFDRADGIVTTIASWVGTMLAWAVLVPFFFLVITPAGLAARLKRTDPLNRTFPGAASSQWLPKAPVSEDSESYRRQF